MNVSASSLERAFRCPSSAVLPHLETANAAAEAGTRKHAVLEALVKHGAESALAQDPEAEEFLMALDVDRVVALFGEGIESEVPMWWRPGEAGRIESAGHRDYAKRPKGSIPGTVDLMSAHVDSVVIGDLKTGMSYVPHPGHNRQLRFLALAAAVTAGVDHAVAHLILVRDGETRVLSAEYDALELAVIESEMSDLLDRMRDAEGDPERHLKGGDHCSYCPAYARCPAIAREGMALVELGESAVEMPPEAVLALDDRIRMVEAATSRAKKIRDNLVRQYGRIERPDGSALTWGPGDGRSAVNVPAALEVLRAEFGTDAAEALEGRASMSVTQDDVKQAVAKAGHKRKGAAALRLLREHGAIVTTPGSEGVRIVHD